MSINEARSSNAASHEARDGLPSARVKQPTPQALPSRSGPSSILVSPRQKGNPILNGVKSVAWEYSDIPADYVVGATTCALFLSLKYHRLHPEYIYNRIRDLKGQYSLRILLTMVDIENHEEPLRELSKTSLVNNVTVMLCWSAQEAGRYLELFKTFENAASTSIRAHQSSSYSDKLVEFITVPRNVNKTDAVGLVSNFGSIRTAVNAGPEEIGLIAGWGEKKVQRWTNAVREPFRVKRAGRRGLDRDDSRFTMSREASMAEGQNQNLAKTDEQQSGNTEQTGLTTSNGEQGILVERGHIDEHGERLAPQAMSSEATGNVQDKNIGGRPQNEKPGLVVSKPKPKPNSADEDMNEGIMAALNQLRKQ